MIKNNGTPILESEPIAAEMQSLSPPRLKLGQASYAHKPRP